MNRVRMWLPVMIALMTVSLLCTDTWAYRHPTLGRFMAPDPQDYVDGNNRFETLKSNPLNNLDPTGTLSLGWHLRVTAQALDETGFAPATQPKFRTGILIGCVYPDVPLPQVRNLVGSEMKPDKILRTVDAFNNNWFVKGYKTVTGTIADYAVPDFLLDNAVVNDIRDWWNSTSFIDPAIEAAAWAQPGIKDTLMYRTHKGDLQYWHGMTGGGETADEMTAKLVNRLSGPFKAYRSASADPMTGFAIGEVLHTIQDLYTPSHTYRDRKGQISRFQDYTAQSPVYHAEKDVLDLTNPKDQALFEELVRRTKRYLELLKQARAGDMTQEAFNRNMRARYLSTVPEGATMGGTEPQFAPRPSVTGKILSGVGGAVLELGRAAYDLF